MPCRLLLRWLPKLQISARAKPPQLVKAAPPHHLKQGFAVPATRVATVSTKAAATSTNAATTGTDPSNASPEDKVVMAALDALHQRLNTSFSTMSQNFITSLNAINERLDASLKLKNQPLGTPLDLEKRFDDMVCTIDDRLDKTIDKTRKFFEDGECDSASVHARMREIHSNLKEMQKIAQQQRGGPSLKEWRKVAQQHRVDPNLKEVRKVV